ncbi:lasso peptide biosynthesis B2 protein [Sphingomonas canadensis]|uniref:Lasso peptide biosynthesis B2 protein n=1 Tax=Sphingomonas canadensis TaxID=1219257 RepID=A0ABW3H7B3_9SPHN|nr:lasso peptide biosynthesis B2 protein [Sphingomonas canadensis]MCW3834783.1 lasso peptide biosynthesis B2 protein [Sphingomonas canadensis]
MRRKRGWKSRLTRMVQVSWRERALLAEAALHLARARVLLALVPFPRLSPRLGTFVAAADPRAAPRTGSADQARIAREIGWAVTRAATHVPFRAVCLPQAIAAQAMLRRRGIGAGLHLGARKGTEKPLEAHAWLDAAGVEVTGYPENARHVEIGCYV